MGRKGKLSITFFLSVFLLHSILLSIKIKDSTSEYFAKALFMGKLANYVDWPENASVYNANKPFIIGVLGENPFLIDRNGKNDGDNWLKRAYLDGHEKIRNKEVKIRYLSDVDEIPGCHLIYISISEKQNLDRIIAVAKENMVLTMSDNDGFARYGIHFNLLIKSGNMKYEINETAIKNSGFKANWRLPKYAEKRYK
jgi:hypothetical protein